MPDIQITKQDVSDLLENFADYVNPDGVHDPWFEVTEVNQQFAWEDIPEETIEQWLNDLVAEGKVFRRVNAEGHQEWAWTAPRDD